MINGIKTIWAADAEFAQDDKNRPVPICFVFKNINTGEEIRLWGNELKNCPITFDENTALLAYYASAELKCFKVLGWNTPQHILDPYIRYRADTSTCEPWETKPDFSVLGCLNFYGLKASMDHDEKDKMRQLALRGNGYTEDEKNALLSYCAEDTNALYELLTNPKSTFKLSAEDLVWGSFMHDVANIELKGIPIDTELYDQFKTYAPQIVTHLKNKLNKVIPVYIDGSFSTTVFQNYLNEKHIKWKFKNGRPVLEQNYVKTKGCEYPDIELFYRTRKLISFFSRLNLDVGADGYARFLAGPFGSKTGRSQPLGSKNIFGQPAVLRRLIKPKSGKAIAYIDYCQEEFFIAGVLSNDRNMIESYRSGDPYLYFGKLAGVIPPDGTKETHPNERKCFKECVLGVSYGMSAYGLKKRIKSSLARAKQLLQYHEELYPDFWEWSSAVENEGLLFKNLRTKKGWPLHVLGLDTINTNTLRNFLIQATGADILREACRLARDLDFDICTTVHDAILIETDDDKIEEAAAEMQEVMAQASENILGGFQLKSDVKIIRYPDCYIDERDDGVVFDEIMGIIEEIKKGGDSHD